MTRRLGAFLSVALASTGAWASGSAQAQDTNAANTATTPQNTSDSTQVAQTGTVTSTGTQATTEQKTEATATEVKSGNLDHESIGFKPMAGVMDYSAGGNTTLGSARAAAGMGIDFNLTRLVTDEPTLYLGPSTGAIYARLGGNNWVGRGEGNSPSIDTVLLPADLKIGANLSENMRLSGHGGGNVTYFSNGGIRDHSGWTAYPNAGADFEVGFGNNLSVLIRPDWMFTGGNTIFTGTAGLGLLIG